MTTTTWKTMRRNQSEPEQGSISTVVRSSYLTTVEALGWKLLANTFGEHAMPDFDNTTAGTPTPENTAPTDLVEETAKTNAELAAEEERKATPGPVDKEYAPSPAEAGLVVATHDRDSVQPPAPASYYAPEAKLKEDK